MYQNLTFIALHKGEAERARDLGRQALLIAHAMNNRLELAKALAMLAGAMSALSRPQPAACLLGASERALERLGAFHQPNDKREIDGMASLHPRRPQHAWVWAALSLFVYDPFSNASASAKRCA
jgi:hypothetical protein